MARTVKEIQEQIDKLEAARKITKARNGYRHYTDRINYLRGELMLQKAHEEKGADDMTRQTAEVWAAYGREWIKEI